MNLSIKATIFSLLIIFTSSNNNPFSNTSSLHNLSAELHAIQDATEQMIKKHKTFSVEIPPDLDMMAHPKVLAEKINFVEQHRDFTISVKPDQPRTTFSTPYSSNEPLIRTDGQVSLDRNSALLLTGVATTAALANKVAGSSLFFATASKTSVGLGATLATNPVLTAVGLVALSLYGFYKFFTNPYKNDETENQRQREQQEEAARAERTAQIAREQALHNRFLESQKPDFSRPMHSIKVHTYEEDPLRTWFSLDAVQDDKDYYSDWVKIDLEKQSLQIYDKNLNPKKEFALSDIIPDEEESEKSNQKPHPKEQVTTVAAGGMPPKKPNDDDDEDDDDEDKKSEKNKKDDKRNESKEDKDCSGECNNKNCENKQKENNKLKDEISRLKDENNKCNSKIIKLQERLINQLNKDGSWSIGQTAKFALEVISSILGLVAVIIGIKLNSLQIDELSQKTCVEITSSISSNPRPTNLLTKNN